MAYKITGNTNLNGKIYIIDPATDSLVKVTSINSGSYEIKSLTNATSHVVMVADDGEAKAFGNVPGVSYLYYPTNFGVQLIKHEQASHAISYSTGSPWKVASDTNGFYLQNDTGYYANICTFVSCPKEVLDGNIVKTSVIGAYAGATNQIYFHILDGAYDCSSATDFPQPASTPYISKGAGSLYSYTFPATTNYQTYQTSVLDLSASTQNDVTIMMWATHNASSYWSVIKLYALDILRGADQNVFISWMTGGTTSYTADSASYSFHGYYGDANAFYDG